MKKRIDPFADNDIYDKILPEVSLKDLETVKEAMRKFKESNGKRGRRNKFTPTQEELDAFRRMMSIKSPEIAVTRPDNLVLVTDKYYTEVANDIYLKMVDLTVGVNLPEGAIRDMSIACAAYLEDIVSEIGVWSAIRNIFLKKLDRKLPFYNCDHEDYFDDDLNKEDVMFIMWQSMCRATQDEERIFSPLSEFILKGSGIILEILAEKFEEAPASFLLRDYVKRCVKKADDYYPARMLSEWLVCNHPLVKIPDMAFRIQDMAEAYKEKLDYEDDEICGYWAKCFYSWAEYIGPMGCSSAEYVAELCRIYGNGKTADVLDNLECIKNGEFQIVQADRKGIVLQGVDGQNFEISIKSISNKEDFIAGKVALTSLVKFGQKWWVNGVVSIFSSKNNTDEPKQVLYVTEKLKWQNRKIIEDNGGRQVFYFKNYKQLVDFMGMPANVKMPDYKPDDIVLFLSKDSHPHFGWDIAKCFSDPENRFYKKRTAEKDALSVIMRYDIADDVADYIQRNNLLADANIYMAQGKEEGRRIVKENLRFLCGFYRVPGYIEDEDDEA